ncbi:ferrochelatase [Colwellia sp. E2M01]|uniref:ferrochelatase n=1 Tax=Colwellia sp. E2M01 TaxID=2841561 RepID=UPI001C09EE4F|nr:ferrochelatase [Colwellia sp. E2M01]MBU2869234.1 ferrochelatase [Colwellia sp. E2M01]
MKSRFSARRNNINNAETAVKHSQVTGVLITNLGSPDEPTTGAVRRYLREFLSDRRVVEIPRLLWLIILHGIILRIRPAKSAKLYQTIWQDDGAPLVTITAAQKEKLASKIKSQYGDQVIVDFAMRYGNPSISSVLQKFQQQGVDKLVVLPLYPQYAGPTTASTFDALSKELQNWRYVPSIHFINTYHHNPLYITALANTVVEHVKQYGKPDKLVLSYHGMPELFHEWGDPYYDFCLETTRLLKTKLSSEAVNNDYAFNEDEIITTFQSRFGKAEWLKPYTDETLENLPTQGDKHIAIISPAFSSDCLETLEELEHENREIFMEAGGEQYHYIAALNDRDDHIDVLFNLVAPLLND